MDYRVLMRTADVVAVENIEYNPVNKKRTKNIRLDIRYSAILFFLTNSSMLVLTCLIFIFQTTLVLSSE